MLLNVFEQLPPPPGAATPFERNCQVPSHFFMSVQTFLFGRQAPEGLFRSCRQLFVVRYSMDSMYFRQLAKISSLSQRSQGAV